MESKTKIYIICFVHNRYRHKIPVTILQLVPMLNHIRKTYGNISITIIIIG